MTSLWLDSVVDFNNTQNLGKKANSASRSHVSADPHGQLSDIVFTFFFPMPGHPPEKVASWRPQNRSRRLGRVSPNGASPIGLALGTRHGRQPNPTGNWHGKPSPKLSVVRCKFSRVCGRYILLTVAVVSPRNHANRVFGRALSPRSPVLCTLHRDPPSPSGWKICSPSKPTPPEDARVWVGT